MPGQIETRLTDLGLALPQASTPMANYVPWTRSSHLVVVSGQTPVVDGKLTATGHLGGGVTVEQGQAYARQCLLNVLVHLRAACGGDLDRVKRVLRLGGFVSATPDFTQHALVMNGASDLAVELFGDAGRHARSTIGVPSLPGGAAVEVEGMFETD